MKPGDKKIKAFMLRTLLIPHFSSHLLLTHKYYNSISLNTLPKKKQEVSLTENRNVTTAVSVLSVCCMEGNHQLKEKKRNNICFLRDILKAVRDSQTLSLLSP